MDDLDAIGDARALLARAESVLRGLRARVPGLASAMSWRSRAAEEFREALGEWEDVLGRVSGEIEAWDAGLARQESLAGGASR